jgi:NifU-like protein involved in Fe-S cluster formation
VSLGASVRLHTLGIISDVKFKTFGCGSAIASSSYMTERVKGMTLEQAGAVKNTEIAKELCLPPVKRTYTGVLVIGANADQLAVHCSLLAEDAIKVCLKCFKSS